MSGSTWSSDQQDVESDTRAAGELAPSNARQGLRIMLVDDNQINLSSELMACFPTRGIRAY